MRLMERVLEYDAITRVWVCSRNDLIICHSGLNRLFELPKVSKAVSVPTLFGPRFENPGGPRKHITISVHDRPTPNRLKIRLSSIRGHIVNLEKGVNTEVYDSTYNMLRCIAGTKTVYVQVEYDE